MSCAHDSHEHVRQTWKQVMHCIFHSLATETYLPLYLNYIPCLGVCSSPCSDEVLWPCVCPSELCETGKIIVINIRSKHFYNFQYAVADQLRFLYRERLLVQVYYTRNYNCSKTISVTDTSSFCMPLFLPSMSMCCYVAMGLMHMSMRLVVV